MTPRAWYTYTDPFTWNYGVFPDPDGNFPKPDLNFAPPDGTPITTLLGGVVSGVNTPGAPGVIPSWGQVVTVRLTTPWNAQARYIAYLHLGSVTVSVGQRVKAGDTIGYAGADAMGLHYRVGLAFQSGPYYGFGDGFLNPGTPDLNPIPLLNQILAGEIPVPSPSGPNSTPTGGGSTGGTVLDLLPSVVPAVAGVTALGILAIGGIVLIALIGGLALFYKAVGK
jgi:hypothetical protein